MTDSKEGCAEYMIEFSVIVATYNATIEQLQRTLTSIVEQQGIQTEIIICDDASKDNHFMWIDHFLHEKGYTEYRLMDSENNQGTVRNMLRGLVAAQGRYAKLIGAGDELYMPQTLQDVRDFMEREHAPCCFGLMAGFRMKDGARVPVPCHAPRDIMAYRDADKRRITQNLLISEDWVCGASVFARREYYIKYISMLRDKVIYCEDWATALALVDGVYMKLYDRYAVRYEVGEGVSTTPNEAWNRKLRQDNVEFWNIFDHYVTIRGRSQLDKWIKLRRRKKHADAIGGKYFGTLLKAVSNPRLVMFELRARRQEREGVHGITLQTPGKEG